jgi:hypothetical protein
MIFNASSFLAGVGTVLATVVIGFGGGVVMTRVFTDNTPRETNKVERRTETPGPEKLPTLAAAPVLAPAAPQIQEAASLSPPSNPAPSEQKQNAEVSGASLASTSASAAQPATPQPASPPSNMQMAAPNLPSPGPQRAVSLTQSTIRPIVRVPSSTKRSKSHDERRTADRKDRNLERNVLAAPIAQTRAGSEQRRTDRRTERDDVPPARARTEYRAVQPYEKAERPVTLQRQHAFDGPSPEPSLYGD